MGILTVGIVTIPFVFEGRPKIVKALQGVKEMAKNVDALLVINNERLRELYSEAKLSVPSAYRKADEILTVAAKSIAEIITIELVQNVDFADVDTTMRNSGVALMSVGFGEGPGRLERAIEEALHNTLLNDNDNIFNAKRVAFVIYFSKDCELGIDEMADVHNFMARFKTQYEVKWGFGYDNTLGNKIKITILATGFGLDDVLSEGHQEYATEDERIKAAEEEMKRKKQEEDENRLIEQYYPDYSIIRPKVEYVVLSADELDDESLIRMMEDLPTYKRTAKEVAQMRKGKLDVSVSSENSQTKNKTNHGKRFISFEG